MRHIETVRNFLDAMQAQLALRGAAHDQTKLTSPELEVFDEYTPKLRGTTYGSPEYLENMRGMRLAIDHHNEHNRHHPEYFTADEPGATSLMERMNLIDLVEMLCDWKAATLRHGDGDIYTSISVNQTRFGYSDEVRMILINTAKLLDGLSVAHHAEES